MSKKKVNLHEPFNLHIPSYVFSTKSAITKYKKYATFNVPHRNVFNPTDPTYGQKLHLDYRDTKGSQREQTHSINERSTVNFESKEDADDLSAVDRRKIKLYKDLEKLAKSLKQNTPNYVLKYLNYSLPKSSEHFTSFNLIAKPFQSLDKSNYYTFTKDGVTYWSCSENFFIELGEWEDQYKMFFEIIQLKTFLKFRLWKGFIIWLKAVKWTKFFGARNVIKNQLIIANAVLGEALLRFKKKVYEYQSYCLIDTNVPDEFNIFYFFENHMKIYEIFLNMMSTFRAEAQKYLYDACTNAIIAEGFYPIDEILVYPSIAKMREAMSYMDRARKRMFCKLLSNFLIYCDYLIINMLHGIMSRAYSDLLSIEENHYFTKKIIDKLPPLKKQNELCFIHAELLQKFGIIEIDPSEDIITFVFKRLSTLWLDSMLEIINYSEDPYFLQFTMPSIMGRQEDKQTGVKPSLLFVMKTDLQYQSNEYKVFNMISLSFAEINSFILMYDEILNNYINDVLVQPYVLNPEIDPNEFNDYAVYYGKNIRFAEKINNSEYMGIIKMKQLLFKHSILPVYRKLLTVLENYLIKLAMDKIEIINNKCEEIMNEVAELDSLVASVKTKTIETLIDAINKLKLEIDIVHDMFIVMKVNAMVVDDSKKEGYMDCEHLFNTVKELVEEQDNKIIKKENKKEDKKEEKLTKFPYSKDINPRSRKSSF